MSSTGEQFVEGDTAAVVSAADVSHHFGDGEARTQVLFDVCIDIPPGQLVVMTGPSGSGKTTLMTLFGALRSCQSGGLRVLGQDVVGLDEHGLTDMRQNIGFIFQLHNLIESICAVDNVLMAARLTPIAPQDARRNAIALLERLGLGHRINYMPSALSGGQRQRVAVARALVNRPRLILADEPTAALDWKSCVEVVGLLQELAIRNGSSVLMVTHESRILDRADRIVSMVDGRITSDVMVKERVVICEMLRKIEFFAKLGTAELSQVADKMRPRRFRDGEVLIRQGETGVEFFVLRDGEVDVIQSDGLGERKVATLDMGRYFGERSLITDEVRNATVVGHGSGLAYALDKVEFDAALAATPSLKEQLQKSYFAR
jgi:putative ABC transport system ATP-binding protein